MIRGLTREPCESWTRPDARFSGWPRLLRLVFGTGVVLGAICVRFVVPGLDERRAELIEMPIMAVVIAGRSLGA